MIIGDGDKTRSARKNMFNPAFTMTGVFSGPHKTKRHMTCINFIDKYFDNRDDTKATLKEAEYRTLDEQIFAEQNKVRKDPKSYVPILKAMLPGFKDKVFKEDEKIFITTTDGKDAVEEAIKYLEAASEPDAPELPPLKRRLEGPIKPGPPGPLPPKDWKVTPFIGTAGLKLID